MIIYGKEEWEHDKHFLNFMDRCMRNNFTLNAKKIQFNQSTVSFFRFCWSKDGIVPNAKEIEALGHMKQMI